MGEPGSVIPDSSAREVQSVRTAFRIVGTVQELDGATLKELADRLDLAKSTVHNYLGTLRSMGYLTKRDGTYRLGLRFLTHGMAAKGGIEVGETVEHALGEVAEDLSHAAWWVVEEFGRGIFVGRAGADDGAVYGRIGKRSYLHTHAPGKAILAQLPAEYRKQAIDRHGLPVHTTKTVTDADTLRDELDGIREQGYAVSDGEAALGVQSVGVAFEDPYGGVHAIGIFGYSHDFSRNRLEQDIPTVLSEAVADIEDALAGRGVD